MFDPLDGPSILVTDDEWPKKERSVRLSVELGPNTQLFLVVVDLLSLLRCHLDHCIGSGNTFIDKVYLHALSSEREHATPAALNPSSSQPYIQKCVSYKLSSVGWFYLNWR